MVIVSGITLSVNGSSASTREREFLLVHPATFPWYIGKSTNCNTLKYKSYYHKNVKFLEISHYHKNVKFLEISHYHKNVKFLEISHYR